jgi:DNA-binding NarL/FixJ family response regulator
MPPSRKQLVVSDGAVEKHISNIFAKINLPDLQNCAAAALLPPPEFFTERAAMRTAQ